MRIRKYNKFDFIDENYKQKQRNKKVNFITDFKDYNEGISDKEIISLFEKLGYNISMSDYVDKISTEIFNNINNNVIEINLIIKPIGITKVIININKNQNELSIHKNKEILIINYSFDNIPTISEIRSDIEHELHHIFINEKGNKTKENYFIVNDILKNYKGKTQSFLFLYYLSFKDEMNCNIQMFFRQIKNNNIKNKKEFLNFLIQHELYLNAKRMENIDIFKYWNEIKTEGNNVNLINELGIGNLNKFLNDVSNQIKNAGKSYIRKMSKMMP